jgi:hypothetical protein
MKTVLTGQAQQDDGIFAGKTELLWSNCSKCIAITKVMTLFYQFRVHNSIVPKPACHMAYTYDKGHRQIGKLYKPKLVMH